MPSTATPCRVPVYWRCTPTECTPFFTSPVSSRTSTAFGSPNESVTQIVADCVGVPLRPGQQMLQPVGSGIATVLGDRPAILAIQPRDQPEHQLAGMAQWLRPSETRRDPAGHHRELRLPPVSVYAMSCGDRSQFWSMHKPRTMPRSPPLPAQTRRNTTIPIYGCRTSSHSYAFPAGQVCIS
jgi:hypothetical protein